MYVDIMSVNHDCFAFRPVVQNTVLQCRITRDKHGLDHGMYPIYHLHLEHSSGQKVRIYVPVCGSED